MIVWLWQFIKGYVTIDVTGVAVERFMNLAAHKGIFLWNVRRKTTDGQTHTARMRVSVRGFLMLRGCLRKAHCKMRIVRKWGLPFILFRYRKRKVLLLGTVFFVISMYALSLFVWRVEVDGCGRLQRDDVLAFCGGQGLRVGAFKYRVNKKDLQNDLMLSFPDIGWADIYIRGTRATITIVETIPKQPILDNKTPCDIVAAKDGLITGIVTGKGTPLVKNRDIVREGEVMVSGTIEMESEEFGAYTVQVHAYAEVWARMYTQIRFTVPFAYEEKVYTGSVIKRRALHLLFGEGLHINFPNSSIPFVSYDRIVRRKQPGVSWDYPMPFIFVTEEYHEYEKVPRRRTLDEAKELAGVMVNNRILREFDFQADIVEKRVGLHEVPDGLFVDALIITNERIDRAVPIP